MCEEGGSFGAAFFASSMNMRNVMEMDLQSTELAFFDEDYWLSHEDYLTAEQADYDLAEILRCLGVTAGRLLDAPCGTGRLSGRLSLLGFDVDGVDLDPRALAVAKGQQQGFTRQVHYVERDLRQLGGLGPYDAVISWFNSFGYFTRSENLALVQTYVSLLRPRGVLLINTLDKEVVAQVLDSGALEENMTVGGRQLSLRSELVGTRLITTRVGAGNGPDLEKRSSVELYSSSEWTAMLRELGCTEVTVMQREQPSLGDPVAEITVRAVR